MEGGSSASAPTMLSDGHHQSFQDARFTTAGRDMNLTTAGNDVYNLHLTIQSAAKGQPIAEQRRICFNFFNFVLRVSKFFQSAEINHPVKLEGTSQDSEFSHQLSTSLNEAGVDGNDCKGPSSGNKQVIMSDLDDLDLPSMQPQFRVVSNAGRYVHDMLCARAGLACWSPGHREKFTGERGVVPGDVGTYDVTDSFKTIFNIWEDTAFLQRLSIPGEQPYELPPNDSTFQNDTFSEGDTIAKGTSSNVKYESGDSSLGRVAAFYFRCTSPQGAVLACTSSADREELVNPIALWDFLVENPGVVYQHANSIRRVADEDSLYIVTGCIKSDSWALAAYIDPAQPPDDVLALVRKTKIGEHCYDPRPGGLGVNGNCTLQDTGLQE